MHTAEGVAVERALSRIFELLSYTHAVSVRTHAAENVMTSYPHPATFQAIPQALNRKN